MRLIKILTKSTVYTSILFIHNIDVYLKKIIDQSFHIKLGF